MAGAPVLLDITQPAAWADLSDARVQQGMALTAAALAAARDAAQATGARFAVVVAPSKEAVYWQGTAAERETLERNERWVAQECERLGIACLPLLPVFASAARRDGPLYFGQDIHWNPAGHRLAAGEIARFIGDLLS